ncbi:MAG: hypothetical protein LBD50_00425 [Rickettsiales bacterium]|jgi:hypothetical protein|nr:hypothetical protein [Rickettsiales bacterium]
MSKKTTADNKSNLVSWIFTKPAKFSLLLLLSFALITLLSVLWIAVVHGLNKFAVMEPMNMIGLFIIMAAAFVFSVFKLIKWLPKDNLDRRSFIAVNNGLSITCFIFTLPAILLTTSGAAFRTMIWLQFNSPALFMLVTAFLVLFFLYVVGLSVSNICSIYRRAAAMGVSGWKILLSFPFGFYLFWFPGYLLPEDGKPKPAIAIKSKWYSAFTDWVVGRPINTILTCALVLILMFPAYGGAPIWIVFLGLVFCVWLLIAGKKKFIKNIGGVFATFAASLNIALILLVIGIFGLAISRHDTRAVDAAPLIESEIKMTETSQTRH